MSFIVFTVLRLHLRRKQDRWQRFAFGRIAQRTPIELTLGIPLKTRNNDANLC